MIVNIFCNSSLLTSLAARKSWYTPRKSHLTIVVCTHITFLHHDSCWRRSIVSIWKHLQWEQSCIRWLSIRVVNNTVAAFRSAGVWTPSFVTSCINTLIFSFDCTSRWTTIPTNIISIVTLFTTVCLRWTITFITITTKTYRLHLTNVRASIVILCCIVIPHILSQPISRRWVFIIISGWCHRPIALLKRIRWVVIRISTTV